MIKTEIIENNGRKYVKTYSDNNVWINQIETGIHYEEAIDVYPCKYTYEETTDKIYKED